MPNGKKDESGLDDFQQDFPQQQQTDDSLEQDFPSQQPGDNGLDDAHQDAQQQLDDAMQGQQQQKQEPHKNRHHRRLESKLQAERESNIQLAARLEALTEAAKFRNDFRETTVDERLVTLYGSDENGMKAARITQSLMEDYGKRAREEALKDFKAEQAAREARISEDQKFVDSSLEDLEDEHGIDLTSDTPAGRKNRADFLTMVEKFSPKDGNGNIQDYADFDEVFDVFQQTRKSGRDNSQNKSLASRGMARGGSSARPTVDKAAERYLLENGLI